MTSEKAAVMPEMVLEQHESVKLSKNSKGYNWEIRLLSTDIPRLQELDRQMRSLWGGYADE